MKKLMFAAAIAASAAAFADPINAISFENSQYASIDNATNLTGKADIPDPGRESATGATGYYFLYEAQSGSSDSSFVTNVAAAFTDGKITGYYNGLENYSNQKYLALDTEGGTLWRSIGQLTGNNDALGTAQAVAATGTYLDTLVQFTVTEDEAPTVGEGDKLAIWLQAGEGTTNLMVKAGYYDDTGTFIPGGKEFTLTGKTIEPGVWYRLTVKVMDDIFITNEDVKNPAFTISINGDPLNATEATIHATAVSDSLGELLTSEMKTQIANGLVFLGLGEGTPGVATTLQGVGFQGTGAVDEIVWTEDDPFPAAVINFTLTRSIGENVTAVAFTIGEDAISFENDAASIVSNATVTIAAPTFAQGYQLAALTVGGTAVADPVFPYSFTMTADTTVAITAEQIPAAYPDYLENADVIIKGKYDTWKTTYQADTQSAWETAFLLNMNPETQVTEGTALLKIASITEVSGGWELEIASDATKLTAETNNDGLVGNGYLAITYAADLATLTSGGTTVNLPVTVTNGKIKVTVTAPGAKFMKAKLTTAAETVAGE